MTDTTNGNVIGLWWFGDLISANFAQQKDRKPIGRNYELNLAIESHDGNWNCLVTQHVTGASFDTIEEALNWSKERTGLDIDYCEQEQGHWRGFSDTLTEQPQADKETAQ